MESIASTFGSCLTLRLLLAGCLAASLAGCADSQRLSDPFSNPFGGDADRTPTASIAAPTGSVQSRPLAPPSQGTPLRPVAAYTAPAYPSERSQSIAGWTAEGGMPIVMAQGETAEIIARRYGIPTAALLKTNGFSSPAQVRPGARLIIPTYNAALAASSGARFASRDIGRAPAGAKLRFVKGPEPAGKKLVWSAKADSKKKLAQSKKANEAKTEKHARLAKPLPGKPEASAAKSGMIVAKAERPEAKRPAIDPTPTSSLPPENGKTTMAASPEFRWPAHGRIIQAYKSGGNEGINIALPEGTSVKAAEAGVVAYAGNDLKGYGNLVLIRHPNGFVSAYANNSDIEVKRGDVVKRGQVIAKSGQSGNVASPQLHFELRKGSTPVDPTQYLAGL
jgi:murein DD-endopeptidase MepM/ murein hydrolase activator NlpD